jgi:hypothetical protein
MRSFPIRKTFLLPIDAVLSDTRGTNEEKHQNKPVVTTKESVA